MSGCEAPVAVAQALLRRWRFSEMRGAHGQMLRKPDIDLIRQGFCDAALGRIFAAPPQAELAPDGWPVG
jgi:hypothetical protein